MSVHYSKIRKMKLIYFNARGRAELARLILAQAGEAYDDERIEGADWPKLKPSKPILVPLLSNSMSYKILNEILIHTYDSYFLY